MVNDLLGSEVFTCEEVQCGSSQVNNTVALDPNKKSGDRKIKSYNAIYLRGATLHLLARYSGNTEAVLSGHILRGGAVCLLARYDRTNCLSISSISCEDTQQAPRT